MKFKNLNKLVQKFNNKAIFFKTYKRKPYPYEKEYRSLIGKTLTIDKLNKFTDDLFHKYMRTLDIESMRKEKYFIPIFDFNALTKALIIELSIEQELTPDNNVLYFDVIDYEPSDYHLTLDIELLKNGKIKIIDVTINS